MAEPPAKKSTTAGKATSTPVPQDDPLNPLRRSSRVSRSAHTSPLGFEVVRNQDPSKTDGLQAKVGHVCISGTNDKQQDAAKLMPPPPAKVPDLGPKIWGPDLDKVLGITRIQGPNISVGKDAAYPRWVVESNTPHDGQNPQQDRGTQGALPSAPTNAVANPVVPAGQHPLRWKFEAGPPSGWMGMKEDELYEFACKHLHNSMKSPIVREQIKGITLDMAGPLLGSRKDDGVVPPTPTAKTNHYGPTTPNWLDEHKAIAKAMAQPPWNGTRRPSLGVRPADAGADDDADAANGDDGQAAPNDDDDSPRTGAAKAVARQRTMPAKTGIGNIGQSLKQAQVAGKSLPGTDNNNTNPTYKDEVEKYKARYKDFFGNTNLVKKYFPLHRFRRMRRWAGEAPGEKANISNGQLAQIPPHPASRRVFVRPTKSTRQNRRVRRGPANDTTNNANNQNTNQNTGGPRTTRARASRQQGSNTTAPNATAPAPAQGNGTQKDGATQAGTQANQPRPQQKRRAHSN